MIKAVLIDPYEETVSDIEYDGNYKSIYPHIHCHVFTTVRLGDDTVFVDDEGLLKLTPKTKFFRVSTYPSPLAGYGMIIGNDDEGEAANVKHDAAYYRPKVHFLDMEMIHIMGYYR